MGTDLAIIALVVLIFIGAGRDRKFDKRMAKCNDKICDITKLK